MDLRDFIKLLKDKGEISEINEEMNWDLEMSAFTAMSQALRGPALMFNKVTGMKEGYRALSGYFGGTLRKPFRRICMAMGIENPDNISYTEAIQEIGDKMGNVIKPIEVATGLCKEVVKKGKDVNLFDFPIVYGAMGDCGRYLMSQVTICKDPDSDWTNWGNYGLLASKKNRMATNAGPGSDFHTLLHAKYWARGESMPVAIAIGGDPLNYLLAGTPLPSGVSEADVAGGMRGAPIELVKCETSDILVPANAEMIIEGEIRPGETLLEGPKTEAYGFTVGPRMPCPAIRVHCVTHRKDPIIPFLFWTGYGVSSLQAQLLTMMGAGLRNAVKGVFSIKSILFATSKWGGYSMIFASKNWYPGFIRDMMDRIRMFAPTNAYTDIVDAVDDDVNVYRIEDVIDAVYTQSNPSKDWFPSSTCWHGRNSGRVHVTLAYLEREDVDSLCGDTVVATGFWHRDNTTKGEPPLGVKRMTFESVIPDDTQKWVVDNWKKWGFEEECFWNKSYIEAPPLAPPPLID